MTQTTKFRWHRGTLEDSIKTTVEVKDRNELVSVLSNGILEQFMPKDVEIKKYGDGIDKRCGWDTHIVCIYGNAVGFTDGPL